MYDWHFFETNQNLFSVLNMFNLKLQNLAFLWLLFNFVLPLISNLTTFSEKKAIQSELN